MMLSKMNKQKEQTTIKITINYIVVTDISLWLMLTHMKVICLFEFISCHTQNQSP